MSNQADLDRSWRKAAPDPPAKALSKDLLIAGVNPFQNYNWPISLSRCNRNESWRNYADLL